MDFEITGKVKIFEGKAAWHYIEVPKEISVLLCGTFKGMIPIIAKIDEIEWKTSLLPKGDGKHFIALKKVIRDKEKIELGQTLSVSFNVI